MKKFVSILLVCLLIIASVPVNASSISSENSNLSDAKDAFVFKDGEGKEIKVETIILKPGEVIIKYYIEGLLSSETSVVYVGNDKFNVIEKTEKGETHFAVLGSDYSRSIERKTIPSNEKSYYYAGRTVFNPYDSNPAHSIRTWYEFTSEDYDYRTLNAVAGSAANVAIGIVAGILSLIFAPIAVTATAILAACAVAAGTTIIGNIIQGAISQTYYCREYNYNVKISTVDWGTTQYFTSSKYQTLVPGNYYSSGYYYDGMMLWNNSSIAYMSYSSMYFMLPYNGVNYYTTSW